MVVLASFPPLIDYREASTVLVFGLELGGLELDVESANDLGRRRRDTGRPDDRGDCRKNSLNPLGVDLELPAASRLSA